MQLVRTFVRALPLLQLSPPENRKLSCSPPNLILSRNLCLLPTPPPMAYPLLAAEHTLLVDGYLENAPPTLDVDPSVDPPLCRLRRLPLSQRPTPPPVLDLPPATGMTGD
jgi:hypothetical protein